MATWYGLWRGTRFGRMSPARTAKHHGVPYALTEEFVTVYRLHPLMPDDYMLAAGLSSARARRPAGHARPAARRIGGGRRRRGAVRAGVALPRARSSCTTTRRTMRRWERIGELPPIDLAAADILRSRETGVAPYNAFRQLLRLPSATSFEELAGGNDRTRARDPRAVRRRTRGGRRCRRPVRRAEAAWVRVQRDRLPDLPADGVAAVAERPLLHRRLHARGLHARRAAWIEATSMGDVLRRTYP